MNLKTYSIIVTGIAAVAVATLGMWALTECDVLAIVLVDALITLVTAVIAASEPDITEFRRFRRKKKRERPLYIYDLH